METLGANAAMIGRCYIAVRVIIRAFGIAVRVVAFGRQIVRCCQIV
jgi:hypothetical protein